MEDDAFKFWGDDHVVARRMLAKPSAGAFRTLVDAGGSGGLANVGALEARCGMGRYVLCQLRVEEKLDTEPAAGQFLAELVDAAAPPGAAPAAIGLMGKRLAADLAAAGVEWTPVAAPAASGPRGVALIDGETVPRLGRDGLAALRRWVEGGGRAVLHALTPETLAALGDALPRRLTLQPNGMLPVLIRRADGLIRGLSNQDLYWFGRATGKPHDPVPLSPEILDFAVADPLPPLDRCVVIEAETMTADESAPHAAADGMHLWRNGALSCDTNFGAGGRYVIGVFAGGTPLDGVFPEVSIALDGRRSAGVVLKQKETRLYVASLDAPPGRHRLSVAFVNDAYDPARHEDRNLFLDKVALAPAAGGESAILNPDALVRMPCGQGEFILDQIRWDGRTASSEPAARYLATLMVNLGAAFRDTVAGTLIPAVSMEPEPGLKLFSREGGCARFAANGSISRRVRFAADGEYRFEVVASGTPARDEYPAVRLSIDGKATAEDQLRSAGWQTLRYRAAVKAGEHEVTLTYFNDFWEPPEDRNLEIRELRLRAAENAGSH